MGIGMGVLLLLIVDVKGELRELDAQVRTLQHDLFIEMLEKYGDTDAKE